jgi:hypothetical protein
MPLAIVIFILIVFIIFFLRKKKSKSITLKQNYEQLIPKDSNYERLTYLAEDELDEKNETIDSIYLVHGTFVGNDPFDLIGLLESAFPNLKATIIEKIKQQTKSGQDFFIKDFGNFHKNISKTIKQSFNSGVDVHFFTWSSSNHHYARLKGAIDLLIDIKKNQKKGDNVLLFGHSHAGQLFALISLLLNDELIKSQLIKAVQLSPENLQDLESSLKLVKGLKLKFVTLGTPIRYPWALNDKIELIHFINHRGAIPQGGGLSSSITTKTGDYIQQWAVNGSDIISTVASERKINDELDLILGIGKDLDLLRKNIKFRKRLHNKGHHFLVDFQDNSKLPNSLLTMFGHAVYTKEKQFNWIVNETIKYLNR